MHADQCGFSAAIRVHLRPPRVLHSPLVFLLWHHASSLHFQPQRNRDYRKNKNLCVSVVNIFVRDLAWVHDVVGIQGLFDNPHGHQPGLPKLRRHVPGLAVADAVLTGEGAAQGQAAQENSSLKASTLSPPVNGTLSSLPQTLPTIRWRMWDDCITNLRKRQATTSLASGRVHPRFGKSV